jgi:DNA gyrase subunit A
MVKKSPLAEYDSNRSGGLIAIALKDGDEVISAATITDDDQLLLISEQGMSLRFTADDSSLRPMGRSTSGVIGMKFRKGDHLLSMVVISKEESERFLITATDGGFAKRTNLDEYRLQGRGGIGVKAAKIDESSRGLLVGALIVGNKDEILVITSGGSVMRTEVEEIRETGRDTMGVRLVDLDSETHVVSLTRVADSD